MASRTVVLSSQLQGRFDGLGARVLEEDPTGLANPGPHQSVEPMGHFQLRLGGEEV